MIMDGWKVFGGTESKPVFQSYKLNSGSAVPLDKWIKAEDSTGGKGVKASDGNYYQPGFHVYANEPKKKLGYRRVFVRNVSCRGNDGDETIIAQEMYVPSDQNAWPPTKAEEEKSLLKRIKDVLPGNA
jgi:hypothetical protein